MEICLEAEFALLISLLGAWHAGDTQAVIELAPEALCVCVRVCFFVGVRELILSPAPYVHSQSPAIKANTIFITVG